MEIIVTAFEPFGGAEVNMSREAVSRLEGVRREILPVSFTRACARIREIARTRPDAFICVGEAGGRNRISVERIAVNLMDARIPDNDGNQPRDTEIVLGGPAAWVSTLPTRKILERLEKAGIPVELSYTAGTYVCNAVFYSLMDEVRRMEPPVRGGFIHVPAAGMETEEIVKGLEEAVRCLREETAFDITDSVGNGRQDR